MGGDQGHHYFSFAEKLTSDRFLTSVVGLILYLDVFLMLGSGLNLLSVSDAFIRTRVTIPWGAAFLFSYAMVVGHLIPFIYSLYQSVLLAAIEQLRPRPVLGKLFIDVTTLTEFAVKNNNSVAYDIGKEWAEWQREYRSRRLAAFIVVCLGTAELILVLRGSIPLVEAVVVYCWRTSKVLGVLLLIAELAFFSGALLLSLVVVRWAKKGIPLGWMREHFGAKTLEQLKINDA